MKRFSFVIVRALSICIVMAAPSVPEAQANLPMINNRLNIGLPTPQMWDGIEVLPMCSANDPIGEKSVEAFGVGATNRSVGETSDWTDEIEDRADTLKMLMDIFLNQKIRVKVKF